MGEQEEGEVDDAGLRESLAPLVAVLTRLATAAAVRLGPEPPGLGSTALAELGEEQRLVSPHWEAPVFVAHTNIATYLLAACDFLSAFSRLFATEPVPVFAHQPLARAVLDAAGTGYWLAEGGISPQQRVMRDQALRLHNAEQNKRLAIPRVKEAAARTAANVSAGAGALGWTVSAKSNRVATEEYPSPKRRIALTLTDFKDPAGVAAEFWWQLSGVAHSGSGALIQSILSTANDPSDLTGTTKLAGYGTSSRSVYLLGLVLISSFTTFVDARLALLGCDDPDWRAAALEARQLSRTVTIGLM